MAKEVWVSLSADLKKGTDLYCAPPGGGGVLKRVMAAYVYRGGIKQWWEIPLTFYTVYAHVHGVLNTTPNTQWFQVRTSLLGVDYDYMLSNGSGGWLPWTGSPSAWSTTTYDAGWRSDGSGENIQIASMVRYPTYLAVNVNFYDNTNLRWNTTYNFTA